MGQRGTDIWEKMTLARLLPPPRIGQEQPFSPSRFGEGPGVGSVGETRFAANRGEREMSGKYCFASDPTPQPPPRSGEGEQTHSPRFPSLDKSLQPG